MIVVVDSGGANLVSLLSWVSRLGVDACVSTCSRKIKNASHVILPGVGSAGKIMERLCALRLKELLQSLTQPVLGICVGMQVLFECSEEGGTPCLGLMAGMIKKLPEKTGLILPHMGWNTLQITEASGLMAGVQPNAYVYFVHSFFAPVSKYTRAVAYHGLPFSAAVQSSNFYGVQFHPERSGAAGLQILKNFIEL
ncbi:imidazole glycerol phosphate synthase subunit HisH [Legionella londiniensis]|uniref:Imidazole glycerol phosphate synthase subunit HisH n=1 Tax=Legionella londiniensis TaxID=45068 RepID=A0A0W0VSB2_9GAMM|nr:imidazole glycerol phosphate synthase subunit HisH [Legionella londiniensis]KTD22566.1 imidazole glycerol phosphate synthase subunit HisH [Legionella londiniensis]STX92497.1 imidazole glycerol phosphate synthase subunit HisH [Legionella londiniensis]